MALMGGLLFYPPHNNFLATFRTFLQAHGNSCQSQHNTDTTHRWHAQYDDQNGQILLVSTKDYLQPANFCSWPAQFKGVSDRARILATCKG
jgi:hypothetical protein